MFTSRVTGRGQTTIPARVRKALGLEEEDRILYDIVDGEVIIRPLRDTIFDHFNTVPAKKQAEDFQQVRRIVRARVAQQSVRRGRLDV